MMDIKVLVTGVGGAGVGNQVLKALRLAESKYSLVVADANPDSLRVAQVQPTYLLPHASEAGYLDELVHICQQERIQVLIPGSEQELKILVRFRKQLSALGVLLLINDSRVVDLCLDKMDTNCFLARQGFAAPRSLLARNRIDIRPPSDFPVVVKPACDSGGSKNVFIAQQEDELAFFACYLLRMTDAVLIQEYVGTPEAEFTVGVLSTLEGEILGSIALHRLLSDGLSIRLTVPNRTGREDLGSRLVISSGFSHGTIEDAPHVRKMCEEVAAALGSQGPLNVQCRVVGGEVLPFEINARFSGSTSIRALVGFNEPDLLIRSALLGESCRRPQFEGKVVLRSLAENCLALRGPGPLEATECVPVGYGRSTGNALRGR